MESFRRPSDSHGTNCSMCTLTDCKLSDQNTQAGTWRGQSEPRGCPGQGEPGAARAAGERLAGSTHPTGSCFSSVEPKHTHARLEVVVSKTRSLRLFLLGFFTQQTAILKSILRMRPLCQVAQLLKAFRILKCLHTTSAQGTSRDPQLFCVELLWIATQSTAVSVTHVQQ